MIEAVALDKARIVREAAEDWQAASASWQWLVDSEDFLWVDPAGLAIDWLGTRMEDALQWEEAVLRRQTKQYLTKWAYDQKKRIGVEAAERAGQPSTEWSGMLDEFVVADRMTRGAVEKMAGVNNAGTVNQGTRLLHGEFGIVPSEYWGDFWLEVAHEPTLLQRPLEERLDRMSKSAREQKHYAEGPPLKKDRHGRYKAAVSLQSMVGEVQFADVIEGDLGVTDDGMWSTVAR